MKEIRQKAAKNNSCTFELCEKNGVYPKESLSCLASRANVSAIAGLTKLQISSTIMEYDLVNI